MKRIQFISIVVCFLSIFSFGSTSFAVQYSYMELPSSLYGHMINDIGDVISTPNMKTITSYNYVNDTTTTIAAPYCSSCSGFIHWFPMDINNSSDLVATLFDYDNNDSIGYLYSGGNYTEIHPSGWRNSWASGINDNGTIVGRGIDNTGTKRWSGLFGHLKPIYK